MPSRPLLPPIIFIAGPLAATGELAPNDPTIADDLVLWLRDAQTDYDAGAGQWDDSSGNDHHATALGDMVERLACYGFETMRTTRRAVFTIEANWKLLAENSYDGYHALTTHHRYLAVQ